MANFNDINNKLNEMKTLYGNLKDKFPAGYDIQREQIDNILEFATNRISSKYFTLLNSAEQNNIFNVLNAIVFELTAFRTSNFPAHLNNAASQISSLKNYLNNIPIENLDKTSINSLMSELKTAKENQSKFVQDNTKNIDDNLTAVSALIKQAETMIQGTAKNLSDSTTVALSKEFEAKRKEENGGEPVNWLWGIIKFKKLGTYRKSSIIFFLILLSIIGILVFGDMIFDLSFNLNTVPTTPKKGAPLPSLNNIELFAIKSLMKLAIISPLGWLAWVQNKKMNLSKRLAEEYWHKEIVTKTFVGMSEQIDKNTEGDTAKRLREELLSMTLTAISKNPAECIDNSNKCDHPINNVLKLSRKHLDNLNKLLDTADKAKKLAV